MGSQHFAILRRCASRARRRWPAASSCALAASVIWASAFADEAGSAATRSDANRQPRYACQLSLLNGGYPRDSGQNSEQIDPSSEDQADPFSAGHPQLDRSRWTFAGDATRTDSSAGPSAPAKGQPVAGDFDGDGHSEIGLFVDGQWFIDLNGNGVWDQGDLWARLGAAGDQPLVGDWDGDGKADIGVYGPDVAAAADEIDSGLPDADNAAASDVQSVAAARPGRPARLVKQGANGRLRADAVDHVLFFGPEGGIAVAGDFNGDGIDTIALFRDGQWLVDVDGDGRASTADIETDFGQPGDLPVAGDFDADGIDELGVYRDGRWLIRGGEEKVIELGGSRLLPVVGDWNGDGRDEAAVYRGQ
jgi:serine-aspartate repeat-containing protein C/D/E